MTSQSKIYQTEYFFNDGRGPQLGHWIWHDDLNLPDSSVKAGLPPNSINGIQFINWVIFERLEVIQIVPEEVHSYWHSETYYEAQPEDSTDKITGVWVIENSEWIKTFNPRHLTDMKHYILEFYDDIVEVICTDLIFGKGQFDLLKLIETDSRFARAYIVKAHNENYLGNVEQALIYYQKYLQFGKDPREIEAARRSIEFLLKAKDE